MKVNVAIIGSGLAGYSVADWLVKFGVSDVAIFTEKIKAGTSRNTGSDKQTYYKLSLENDDSYRLMAKTYYDGGAIDGDIAIVEASNSLRCFYKLVDYGVPFPQNDNGVFVGYKTDHDDSKRATSIGPLTSKIMTEVLEKKVIEKGVSVYDNAFVVKLLKNEKGIVGFLYWDSGEKEIKHIEANYVVLATGGASTIYYDSVYPNSQHGSMSLALDLGLNLSNFAEWQYGIASIKFRWNLSGSYQQVIPRYVSIDKNGNEYEFLCDYIKDNEKLLEYIFLKGYEWPFDSRKILRSSQIDMAIINEKIKGRKVYIDYTKNPNFYDIEKVAVAKEYLEKADAIASTPIERLKKLNPKAIELYKNHKIDLEKEYLEIGVSAQHCNGGVEIDKHYQSKCKGLYVIGEASGNFGVYRPGGSALNSTQVGGLEVAKHIKNNIRVVDFFDFENYVKEEKDKVIKQIAKKDNTYDIIEKSRKLMSNYCSIIRNMNELPYILEYMEKIILNNSIYIEKYENAIKYYIVKDMLLSQIALLKTVMNNCRIFGTRGGAIAIENGVYVNESDNIMDIISLTNKEKVEYRIRKKLKFEEDNFEKLLKEI